ncbi:MAG: hypothetical protein U1F08_02330 [Steroidobacteraceae bacterium]
MTRTRIATCALLLLAAGSAQAFTAEELAAKNIEARGGTAALGRIQTVRRSGQLIVNGGQLVLGYVETRRRPSSVKEEVSLQGLTQVECYDGKEGWRIDPFQGRKDPERTSADDLKGLIEDAQIGGPLEDWAARGAKLEYMGTEDIDGTEAHKLRLTQKNGDIQYVYLDPDYFLEIRVESERLVRGVKQSFVADFGEYEKVDGVYWATAIAAGRKGDSDPAKIAFDKVEVNIPLDPNYFSFPGAN